MTEFLSYFALAQMFTCILLLSPLWKKNQSVRLYILLMLSGSGYLLGEIISPMITYSAIWWFELIGGNALPGMFWLVSLSVFGDHVELKPWQYFLASLTLLVPLTSALVQISLNVDLSLYPISANIIKYGAMALELFLICYALVIACKHWRDDLVQERRYIRGGVISVSALYIFLVIILKQLFAINWSSLDFIIALVLAFLTSGINFLLFNLRASSLFETVNSPSTDNDAIKPISKDLRRIVDSMVVEKLYQQDGITIAGLAKHLSIHEYKLRQLINGEMNYRNFNDFLNFYRIKEVSESLSQVSFSQTPVLTLALESGFRSLSSFNKAFKNTHGLTPTEFRKKKLNS